MESLNAQIRAVKLKFPDQADRIESLFEQNEDFRALCKDYFLCINFLEKFMKDIVDKHDEISDYKSVRQELEKDLQEMIYKK